MVSAVPSAPLPGAAPSGVPGTTTQGGLPAALDRAVLAARALGDTRCRDILVLDLRAVASWTDFMVIATGASRRQMAAAADEAERQLVAVGDRKHRPGTEGYDAGGWMAIDFSDLVIHLFDEEKRGFYGLENLWGDAPRIAWEPAGATPE